MIIGAQSTIGLWKKDDYPIEIYDINCTGLESTLLDCQYNTVSSIACDTNDIVGTFCQKSNFLIFLMVVRFIIDLL